MANFFSYCTIESWLFSKIILFILLVSLIRDVSLDCREANVIDPQNNIAFLLSETSERGQ